MFTNKIKQSKVQNKINKYNNKKISFVLCFVISLMFFSATVKASSSSEEDFSLKEDLSNPKVVKILSIDGGGIRGLIPLYFLKKLETEMGQPIAEIFDIISGTSTGGIIALGLTTPADPNAEKPVPKYRPDDMIELYSAHGDQIFGKKHKKWFNFGGLTRPRYSAKGVTKVAEDLLGDSKLSDTITNVIVTSFETERYKPQIFNSYLAKRRASKNFYLKDIAVGTSAAPTYFKPKRLKNMEGKNYTVIDGGVIINNPALAALASAREIYPNAEDFLVISLGTGKPIKRVSFKSTKRAGGIKWIKPLTSIMMDGAATTVDFQMQQFFPDEYIGQGAYKKKYFRFQPTILQADSQMDNVSKANVQSLTLAAESAWGAHKGEIKAFIKRLKEIQASDLNEEFMSFGPSLSIDSEKENSFGQEMILKEKSLEEANEIITVKSPKREKQKCGRGKSLLQISVKRSIPRLYEDEEDLPNFVVKNNEKEEEETHPLLTHSLDSGSESDNDLIEDL